MNPGEPVMLAEKPQAQSDDATLVRALACGDMDALGTLVLRHQQAVRSLAYRVTGRWDCADDIAQEAFLRVLRAAPSYSPSASFSTWLYRIVVNLCLDERRRRRPMQLAQNDSFSPVSPDTQRQLVQNEAAHAVQRHVQDLPPRQRMALVLHRFQAQNHAQIAAAMDCSEAAVESLLVRAYAQLRQKLREWADF